MPPRPTHPATPGATPYRAAAQPQTRVAVTALVAALAAALSACGGGGGDAGAPVDGSDTLAINVGNRDQVARATLVGMMGLDGSSELADPSLTGANAVGTGALRLPQVSGRWTPLALTGPLTSLMRQLVEQPARRALAAGSRQPDAVTQAVYGPTTVACTVSGSVSVTINDADNSGTITAGDTLTSSFASCVETAGTVVGGQVQIAYVAMGTGTLSSYTARVEFTGLSVADTSMTMRLNGRVLLTAAQRSTVLTQIDATVESPMSAALTTGGTLRDTVTLAAGFTEQSTHDSSVAAPVAGGTPGLLTSSVSGTVASTALGGSFVLSTPTAIQRYDADEYPRAGVMLATGRNSQLRMTAVSATEVRLETDADNNGTFENSSTVAWTTLLGL